MSKELGKIIETGSQLHVVIRFFPHLSMRNECRILDAFEDTFEEMNENTKNVMRLTVPLLKVQRLAVLITAMLETADLIEGFEFELK